MWGNEVNKTECVEVVLRFFETAVKELDYNRTIVKHCEDKTQDIMHELELVDHTYHERAKLAAELAEVRQQRRTSKDLCELLTPLVSWYEKQQPAVNALTRVLGEMRKIDEKRDNRLYYKRADGSHDVIGRRNTNEH